LGQIHGGQWPGTTKAEQGEFMAVFEEIVGRLAPLDHINDRLLAKTAVNIFCGTAQAALDGDHRKAVLWTKGVGVFDLSH